MLNVTLAKPAEKKIRMIEHQTDIKKHAQHLNVTKHANENKHSFNLMQSETLATEPRWRRRIIKESLLSDKWKIEQ